MVPRLPPLLALALLLSAAGCGRVATTTAPTGGATQTTDAPFVTLSASGAKPQVLHIFSRELATFTNNDNRVHELRADVRLNEDARCTAVGVGVLQPGESRKAELLPSGIVCYYRDEREPSNAAFQGLVLMHY